MKKDLTDQAKDAISIIPDGSISSFKSKAIKAMTF
jgi:hypothetical protein